MTETVLDDDLRERWADPQVGEVRLAEARAELERRLDEDDGGAVARSHVGRAHQRLSEACRLCGLLDEALTHKEATLGIWRAQEKYRATFLVELQRALVLAELGREEAEVRMKALAEQLEGDERLEPFYRDFWLEYAGRCACLAGDRDAAEVHLVEALSLRRATRADRIVRWTEHALRKVRGADDSV